VDRQRLLRLTAFTLMFGGLMLSLWGQGAERDSFQVEGPQPSAFDGTAQKRWLQLERSYVLKEAGVVLVLMGPEI